MRVCVDSCPTTCVYLSTPSLSTTYVVAKYRVSASTTLAPAFRLVPWPMAWSVETWNGNSPIPRSKRGAGELAGLPVIFECFFFLFAVQLYAFHVACRTLGSDGFQTYWLLRCVISCLSFFVCHCIKVLFWVRWWRDHASLLRNCFNVRKTTQQPKNNSSSNNNNTYMSRSCVQNTCHTTMRQHEINRLVR